MPRLHLQPPALKGRAELAVVTAVDCQVGVGAVRPVAFLVVA